MDPPTEVVFDGKRYRRYPNSDARERRVYYHSLSDRSRLHRVVWEHAHGKAVPDGMHIHHVNGDSFDNRPENLLAVEPGEHRRLHPPDDDLKAWMRWNLATNAQPRAAEWHRSPEGREWHRQHGIQSWEGRERIHELVCEGCGEKFQAFRPDGSYCSSTCRDRHHYGQRRYQVQVPCPICGTEFWQNKYRPKPETCSSACGTKLRMQRARGRVQPDRG